MGEIKRKAGTTSITLPTDWTNAAGAPVTLTPGASDIMQFDDQAFVSGFNYQYTWGGNLTNAGFNFVPATFSTMAMSMGSPSSQYGLNSPPPSDAPAYPNGHILYIADGKVVTLNVGTPADFIAVTTRGLRLLLYASAPSATFSMYIGTNSGLDLSTSFSTNSSLAGPITLQKRGPGYIAMGKVDAATYNINTRQFFTTEIYSGELRLSGHQNAYVLGVSSDGVLNTVTFNADAGQSPTVAFSSMGSGTSRTIGNPLFIYYRPSAAADATIAAASGFTATMSGTITPETGTAATLRTVGPGTVVLSNANITTGLNAASGITNVTTCTSVAPSRPLTVASGATLNASAATTCAPSSAAINGTLSLHPSLPATFSVATTLAGTGTLNLANGSTLSGAIAGSGYTGNITGDFTLANGGAVELGANISGNVTCSGGAIFLTRTGSHVGAISSLGFVEVTVSGNFTNTSGSTNLNAAGANSWAYLTFDGAAASFSGRTIAFNTSNAAAQAIVYLKNGATLNSPLTANSASLGTDGAILSSEDGSNTYSGQITSSQSTGSIKVRCRTGNTLTLSGALSSSNGRTFAINADVGYAGKVVITGGGFNNADMSLSQGTLHLNASSSIGIGGLNKTLTVSNAGTTVACSSSNATYAAQIVGNLSMGANTVLKFGAPA